MYLEIVNSVYALHKWRSWRTCESGCLCTSVFVLLLLLALMPILDLRFMLPKLSLLPLENHPLPVHVYYRCPPSHLSVGVTFFFFFLLFRFASFFPYANSHQVHQEVPIQKKMESVFLFSKSSLNIWKFLVHILLKPHFQNFEHYFASV